MADGHLIDKPTEHLDFTALVTSDQQDGARETLESYRSHLEALNRSYEVLVIVNGAHERQLHALKTLAADWPELTVIGQLPWVGEDAALATGLRRSRGDLVLLLPGWPQVDPKDLSRAFDALERGERGEGDGRYDGADAYDMVSAVRSGRPKGGWQGLRSRLFAQVLTRLFGTAPSDPFCRARLVRRAALEDTVHFGVRQHFLPVIAAQRGHTLTEVDMAPAPATTATREARYFFKPMGHLRALLDALALYVVLKFLRRPLRFFGAIGFPIFLAGALFTTILVVRRLMGETALADRPALIFTVMMVVLGIQILAIGLVGEIIIFAGARRIKQYDVAEIITSDPNRSHAQQEAQDET